MFVKAREGEPFEELYRRFKRGSRHPASSASTAGSSGSSRPTRCGGTRSARPRARSGGP